MSSPTRKPRPPAGVVLAGIIWLGVGVLAAGSTFAWLVARPAYAQISSEAIASPYYANYITPADLCSLWVGTVFGATFVLIGLRTVTGAGRGTVAAGLFSVTVGLAFLIPGAAAAFVARTPQPLLLVAGTACLALAIVCIGAGLLALVGHSRYSAWHRAQRRWEMALDSATPNQ